MKEHTIVPRVWNCNDNRDLIQYLRRRHHEKLGGQGVLVFKPKKWILKILN